MRAPRSAASMRFCVSAGVNWSLDLGRDMAIAIQNPTAAQYRRAFRPYGAAIGDLVYSWNSLHQKLAILFELVVKSPSRKMGMAIWYSTDSDFTQRKMLRAAVEKCTQLSAPQRDDITWALNKIDDSLRHNRNDALHSPFVFMVVGAGFSVIPDFTSDSPRAQSLWRNTRTTLDLKKSLREYNQLCSTLSEFFGSICYSILAPAARKWPDRPALPHAHRKKNRRGSSRQRTAKRSRRPPGSSPA